MSATPKISKAKDRSMTVSCPNCRRTTKTPTSGDRASCAFCGYQWPWSKLGLVMGKRSTR